MGMDLPNDIDDEAKRHHKKKKHHRDSRSESEGKKKKKNEKERDRSKSHKKHDKEKKHKKDKSRQKDGGRDKDKSREKQKSRDKQKQRQRQKQRQKYKEKERVKDLQKQKNKQKDRSRSREKDKAAAKGFSKDNDRDYDYNRQRNRSGDTRKRNDGDNYRGRDSNRYSGGGGFRRDQGRGFGGGGTNWKGSYKEKDRFRFDSPPKSDESDMSEDPEKMDKLNRMKAAKQLVTSKADRKLYLGNLPPNITSTQLMEMLNSALKKMEINCDVEGDSIVSSWISPDGVGHYAFVEFRTAQEATNGLTLNGASLYGYQLKLGRPKQYIEYNKQLLSEFGSDGNIDTIIKKVAAMGGFAEMGAKVEQKIVCPPSRVIVLKHIVTIEELAIDEEYNEILYDIEDMAKRYGTVLKIVIPRPHQIIDLQVVMNRVKGLGYIFIQYKSVDQAKYARKQFIKQMFSDRSVACSYFPENRFENGEYDINQKVIIEF